MKTTNEMNNLDEKLRQIQKVEPSPFLFTRIQAKLEGKLSLRVSRKMALASVIGLFALIAINSWILNKAQNKQSDNLLQQMNLIESQQIYR
ncbi:hypothetical protein [Fluviicola taffensis]|nr:hypothetical protein [Fluviicola taffensis]